MVASGQFLLASQYLVANALVEDVGTLVRARHHHRLVQSHLTITAGQRLYQFVARHHLDIRKPVNQHLGKSNREVETPLSTWRGVGGEAPDLCRIPQNATLLTLSQHLVERTLIDMQAKATQHGSHQRRTLLLAYGWQLCLVANEH